LFETGEYRKVNPEVSDWNQNDVEMLENEESYGFEKEEAKAHNEIQDEKQIPGQEESDISDNSNESSIFCFNGDSDPDDEENSESQSIFGEDGFVPMVEQPESPKLTEGSKRRVNLKAHLEEKASKGQKKLGDFFDSK